MTEVKNESEDKMQTAQPSQSTSLDLILIRGSSSLASRWFGFELTDVAQKMAVCKLCWKSVAVKNNSATNLFHHLPAYHHTQSEEYEKL